MFHRKLNTILRAIDVKSEIFFQIRATTQCRGNPKNEIFLKRTFLHFNFIFKLLRLCGNTLNNKWVLLVFHFVYSCQRAMLRFTFMKNAFSYVFYQSRAKSVVSPLEFYISDLVVGRTANNI